MTVKQGYKLTEVGVIPEDWEVTTVGSVANISSGGTPSRKNLDFWNGDIPWITTTQIDFNEIYSAEQYITKTGLQASAAKWYPKGTILMAMYGQGKTRGKTAILGIGATINQACAAISVSNKVYNKFLSYCLISNYEKIRELSNSGGQENLNSKIVKSITTPLPPTLPEQTAIANALSNADAYINSLEQLIAKKQQLKQGTMQQLLTGKKRLEGFSGEWEEKFLKLICWYQEGPGVRKYQFTSSGVKLLNGTNISNASINLESTDKFINTTEAFGSYSHFLAHEGDLVIASSGVTIERFHEKIAFIKSEHLPLCMNTSTIRFKPDSLMLLKEYLFYFLSSKDFKIQISEQATGSAQLNFGPSHLDKIIINIPSLPEQTAIANILTNMDNDIQELQNKLTKAKHIKQGMMQELLTGKTRLVQPH